MQYYTLPINPAHLHKGKLLETTEIRKSIHQNIRMILESFQLSYRFDPSFGSVVNKYQGSTKPNEYSDRIWRESIREDIQKNMLDMLSRYETRIKVKDVLVELVSPDVTKDRGEVNVRVKVVGNLTLGRREKFHYPDSEITEEAQEVLPLLIPIGKSK